MNESQISTRPPGLRQKIARTKAGQWLKGRVNSLLAARKGRANTGVGTFIDPTCHFLGRGDVLIGKNVVVGEGSVFNVNHKGAGRAIVIGDHSFIGRRTFFSPAKTVELGPYALLGPDCRFLGADHVMTDPFKPYISTGTTADASIKVGANCWFGANVMVLGEVEIGHGSILGAGAVLVSATFPPFSIVVGSPGRVVKRYSMAAKAWVPAGTFTAEDEAALPDEATYLALLREIPPPHLPAVAAARSQGHLP